MPPSRSPLESCSGRGRSRSSSVSLGQTANSGGSDTEGRRLEFTGERCVPWADDVQIVYEHLHRYRLAAELTRGKRVLDLGSGEGYGAAILARSSAHVDALDIDRLSIDHSRAEYRLSNLVFHEGSALELDRFEDDVFDVVVCFEVIEHVAEQDQLVKEVRRVLNHDGLFLLSTPNRDVYNEGRDQPNPFHVRELNEEELRRLLADDFPYLAVWGQGLAVGSELVLRDASEGSAISPVSRHAVQWAEEGWTEPAAHPAVYLVCLASAVELPPLPPVSLLTDETRQLLRYHERRAAEARRKLVRLRYEAADANQRAREAEDLIALITTSRGWRLLDRARAVRSRARGVLARVSPPHKGEQGTPDAISKYPSRRSSSPPDAASIRFPDVTDPLVSIVIPVHDNLELTLCCLGSIQAHGRVAFDVVVVDDASTEETARTLDAIEGLRIERNDENVGFVHSCNRGAAVARGRYILFQNNDVEVQSGWLEALVDAMESAPDVGVVGSKLVYPDGRLQEAGAFIWSDATGWNHGRGGDPDAAEFNYRREVDYCSGASLLVRRDLFESLGGLDTRFAPAYYEDADLCFAARSAGYRVLYEPRSVVVHHEGASHGTDDRPSTGGPHGKSTQHRNRHVFAAKWSNTLLDHRPPGSAAGLLGGRFDDRLRVLVADAGVPAHDRDAGSLRMTWILRLLRSLGCDVTLFPQSRTRTEPYTSELQSLGIEVAVRSEVVRGVRTRACRALRPRDPQQAARRGRVRR